MASSTYHPEMGETRDGTALFHSSHLINSYYSIEWPVERDEEARGAFSQFRLRPTNIERRVRREGEVWTAICTSNAERKLYNAGLVCCEMLLD